MNRLKTFIGNASIVIIILVFLIGAGTTTNELMTVKSAVPKYQKVVRVNYGMDDIQKKTDLSLNPYFKAGYIISNMSSDKYGSNYYLIKY